MISWLAPLIGTALGLPFAYGVIRGMRIAFREMEPEPKPRLCPECIFYHVADRTGQCSARGVANPAYYANPKGDCFAWKPREP